MKTRFTLTLGLLMLVSLTYAQEETSARSNSLRLEFKSSPAKISWISPTEFMTEVKDKGYTVKIGLDVKGTEIERVDIYVNDRHIARGEVLVLNENFCVRVSEIIQHGTQED